MKLNLAKTATLAISVIALEIKAASIIVNGSFEAGTFSQNYPGRPDTYLNGSPARTGWTAGPGTGAITWGLLTPDVYRNGLYYNTSSTGPNPADLYCVGLYGVHSDFMQQSFATQAGQRYEVTFEMAQGGVYETGTGWLFRSTTGGIGATVTGATVIYDYTFLPTLSPVPPNAPPPIPGSAWEMKQFTFVADGPVTTLRFTGRNDGVQFLDDIAVVAVPEPSVAALLLVGAAVASRIVRRSIFSE